MTEQHWRVQDSSYRMPRDHKPVVLYYDPTPGGKKNADGTTTISLNFPALVITEWVNMPEEIGKQIAAELNTFPDLVKALEMARARIEYLGAACASSKHFEANYETFLPAIDEVLGRVKGASDHG